MDIVIKCEKRCILTFEYIEKSLDGFCYDLDKYRDIPKKDCYSLGPRR